MSDNTNGTKELLYDVVICEISTLKIDSIAGKSMRLCGGFYNARKRLETVRERLNSRYEAKIVPSGNWNVGDIPE